MAAHGHADRTPVVAQFIETMNMGGAEHLAVQIANELAARGHRSHLVVATGPGPMSARVAPGVTVHHLGFVRASVLNPLAVVVWLMCNGERSVAQICAELVEHFGEDQVAPQQVREDVTALLRQFEREGLVD